MSKSSAESRLAEISLNAASSVQGEELVTMTTPITTLSCIYNKADVACCDVSNSNKEIYCVQTLVSIESLQQHIQCTNIRELCVYVCE